MIKKEAKQKKTKHNTTETKKQRLIYTSAGGTILRHFANAFFITIIIFFLFGTLSRH